MPDAPIDLEALAARVMRPERPALADARAAVAGLVDPREAWLALARRGLISPDWLDAPSRRFAAPSRSSKRDASRLQRRLAGLGIAAVRDDAIVLVVRRAGDEASPGSEPRFAFASRPGRCHPL